MDLGILIFLGVIIYYYYILEPSLLAAGTDQQLYTQIHLILQFETLQKRRTIEIMLSFQTWYAEKYPARLSG